MADDIAATLGTAHEEQIAEVDDTIRVIDNSCGLVTSHTVGTGIDPVNSSVLNIKCEKFVVDSERLIDCIEEFRSSADMSI